MAIIQIVPSTGYKAAFRNEDDHLQFFDVALWALCDDGEIRGWSPDIDQADMLAKGFYEDRDGFDGYWTQELAAECEADQRVAFQQRVAVAALRDAS